MSQREDSDWHVREMLEQSRQRESELQRRLDEVERECSELRDEEPRAKRQRVEETSAYPDPSLTYGANGMPL